MVYDPSKTGQIQKKGRTSQLCRRFIDFSMILEGFFITASYRWPINLCEADHVPHELPNSEGADSRTEARKERPFWRSAII
jgi:hypothetical protein